MSHIIQADQNDVMFLKSTLSTAMWQLFIHLHSAWRSIIFLWKMLPQPTHPLHGVEKWKGGLVSKIKRRIWLVCLSMGVGNEAVGQEEGLSSKNTWGGQWIFKVDHLWYPWSHRCCSQSSEQSSLLMQTCGTRKFFKELEDMAFPTLANPMWF